MVKQVLMSIGLDVQESTTYMALLELGQATAAKLAENTGIGRVNTYHILSRLIARGIVTQVLVKNVRHFSAYDPSILLRQIKEKEQALKEALPELSKSRNNHNIKSNIELYQGKDEVGTILQHILMEKKPYLFMGGLVECQTERDAQMRSFLEDASKLRISGRILERSGQPFYVGKNEDYRYIAPELIGLTSQVIWGNNVATFVWSSPFYIIKVKSEEVAKSKTIAFNFLWTRGKVPEIQDRNSRQLND